MKAASSFRAGRLPLFAVRQRRRQWQGGVALALSLALAPAARADDTPEYRLKAAFLYNFALFTEWPPEVGTPLNMCIYGPDPFGRDIDELQGKAVGARSIAVQRKAAGESLGGCQVVYVAPQALGGLIRVLNSVNGRPVLTVADSPGAARQGVSLNMTVAQDRITFEANLQAARGAGLNFSSKLLRLATEVLQ